MARQWQPLTSRPDLFTGKLGQRLLHGTRGTIFELVTAGVVTLEGEEAKDQIVFVDSGSNVNFIREDLARRLGLTATPTSIQIKVVDEDFSERRANVYQLGLRDKFGGVHWMEALGVNSIPAIRELANLEEVKQAFPRIPDQAVYQQVGEAEILLSMSERHLHSSGGEAVGRLRLEHTPIGCGRVLTGLGKAQVERGSELLAECWSLQAALAAKPL